MPESSSFIKNPNCDTFESLIPIDSNSSTADCYEVTINGKKFFMKQLRADLLNDIGYRILFKKEYELGSNISHKNIIKYEQFHEDEDCCYILTEYICGETLDSFIDTHPHYFSSRSNLDKFFNQLLSALKCLHENHVVYSDLKPQNIIITLINNDVKLIDFGFCFTDAYINTEGTTQRFSAPEHLKKSKLEITTDIYGVGKIIEYIGKNSSNKIPGIYAKIMLRCLKKRKQDRLQSTDEIIKLINKRKHIIRKSIIGIITCVILLLGYKTISYNEHFIAWWDSFQIFTPNVNYDIEFRHSYYRILSEEDGTCEVVGHGRNPNIYLADSVSINGKKYRLTHIADSAFVQKYYIKSVYIPEGVLSIGKEAFRECKNLTIINLPNSITHVDKYAFYACESVSYLKLSSSLTHINNASFTGSAITNVEIPEGITTIGLDAFGNCLKLKDVKLPSTLKEIDRGVFWNCISLKQITIPASVTTIGEFSFYHCNALTDIYNLAKVPQSIPPIHHNPSQITLHVPAESIEAYKNALYWNQMKIVPIN